MREGQCTDGISRFRGAYNQFPVDSVHLLGDGECPVFNIQVRPLEGQQFTPPQAGGQFQIEGRQQSSFFRFCEVHSDFLLRQDLHFFLFKLRQLVALGGVGENESLRHRLLQAVVQQCVNTPHHSGTEAGIFQWREVFALNSSAFLQIVVKPLDLNGGQLVQGNISNSGYDMVLDVIGVVGFGVGPDAGLGVDLVSCPYPQCHCVGSRFGYIQPLAFADRGFEFFLDLGLRFAQHVLDDPFSALRVIARRVPALPATILALSDVPLAVCSSFRHKISPFRNEQYRNQGDKAIQRWNCYQKVIICPSEPRRLIFDYCGAIFALPEETLLWLQRCDFWTVESLFLLTTAAQNMRDLRRKLLLLEITFSSG